MINFTAKEFLQYCLHKKLIILCFMLIGVFSSVMYNFTREDVYESKMTIKVNSEKTASVRELVDAINQKYMLNAIDGEDGVLGEDYSKINIYAKSSNDSGYVDIYVHGNSPEAAKSSCEGVYEHIKYYNEQKKNGIYETAFNAAEVVSAKKLADEALDELSASGQRITLKSSGNGINDGDEGVSKEQNEFFRKEYIYRAVLQNEVITLTRSLCNYDIIVNASLPTQPVSKKYSIVVVGALVTSVCAAIVLLFTMYCIKRFQESSK